MLRFKLTRHRRYRRRTSDLARLLIALDAISATRPGDRRRRTGFLSLGR
jgi:hypothetical protein